MRSDVEFEEVCEGEGVSERVRMGARVCGGEGQLDVAQWRLRRDSGAGGTGVSFRLREEGMGK